jgi:hypothetical protein
MDERPGRQATRRGGLGYMNADSEEFDPALRQNEPDAATRVEGGGSDAEPDVLLDVSELRVDEISLEVEDLRARVALQADVLALLQLHVGVEAELGRVQLTIKGVEAQVLLKVRLDNVARIIDRVLTTIDNNPDIVEGLIERAGEATAEVGARVGEATGELGRGAGSAAEEVGSTAGTAVRGVGRGTGRTVKDVGQGAGQTVEEVAERARPKRSKAAESPRRSAEGAAEGRPRRRRADSPAKKRSTKGSRPSPDRRSEED